MTTYPLSEAATVHVGGDDDAHVAGRDTLEECRSRLDAYLQFQVEVVVDVGVD